MPHPAAAQPSMPSNDDLQSIKGDITGQMLDYGRLTEDNQRLRDEYESLKPRYEQHMKDVQASVDEEQLKMAALQNQLDSREYRGHSLEEMEADLMIKKAQIAKLKGQFLDMDDQERLWKLKAADTEYQRQTLELELALKQSHYEKSAGAYLGKIDQLNRTILRNRLEEKELMTQYSLLEDEANILAKQNEIFEKENAHLQKEAVKYADLRDQTKTESDKSQQDGQESQQALTDKQKQKEELEKQLQDIKDKRRVLDEQLTEVLKDMQAREQLAADIKNFKEDNDRLQAVISQMQSRAETITP